MTTEKITQYLEQMAAKLGVAAEHVYGVLVRQQWTEGVTGIIGGALFLVLALMCAYLLVKFREESGLELILIPVGLFAMLAWMVGIDGIKHVMNPEYYALKEIMDVIGGATR
jgi:hypothetical protein